MRDGASDRSLGVCDCCCCEASRGGRGRKLQALSWRDETRVKISEISFCWMEVSYICDCMMCQPFCFSIFLCALFSESDAFLLDPVFFLLRVLGSDEPCFGKGVSNSMEQLLFLYLFFRQSFFVLLDFGPGFGLSFFLLNFAYIPYSSPCTLIFSQYDMTFR
jgi:hypothetical protein